MPASHVIVPRGRSHARASLCVRPALTALHRGFAVRPSQEGTSVPFIQMAGGADHTPARADPESRMTLLPEASVQLSELREDGGWPVRDGRCVPWFPVPSQPPPTLRPTQCGDSERAGLCQRGVPTP